MYRCQRHAHTVLCLGGSKPSRNWRVCVYPKWPAPTNQWTFLRVWGCNEAPTAATPLSCMLVLSIFETAPHYEWKGCPTGSSMPWLRRTGVRLFEAGRWPVSNQPRTVANTGSPSCSLFRYWSFQVSKVLSSCLPLLFQTWVVLAVFFFTQPARQRISVCVEMTSSGVHLVVILL